MLKRTQLAIRLVKEMVEDLLKSKNQIQKENAQIVEKIRQEEIQRKTNEIRKKLDIK